MAIQGTAFYPQQSSHLLSCARGAWRGMTSVTQHMAFLFICCSSMYHARAICHITELTTGSCQTYLQPTYKSLPCGWFGLYVCVGGWAGMCISKYRQITWPRLCRWEWAAVLTWGSLREVCLLDCNMADYQIKGFHITFLGEQVNKQIMLKEAWSMNAHTCVHRYCCVGPSVPLAERVNPCMESQESQATCPL